MELLTFAYLMIAFLLGMMVTYLGTLIAECRSCKEAPECYTEYDDKLDHPTDLDQLEDK